MNPAQNKGFTLVELLVVISIIAILSVIGIALFTNVQKNARDSKRKADINAIANVLEANKDLASGNYQPVTATMFASGSYPFDPFLTVITAWTGTGKCLGNGTNGSDTSRCLYCFKGSNAVTFCSNRDSTIGDPYISVCVLPTGGAGCEIRTPLVFNGDFANFKTQWTICANLEGSPGYYCKSSAQ